MEEPLFGSVELIEQRNDLGVIEPVIAEPLPDMGPVFLFDMGVVILVVGPAPGKLYGLFSPGKVPHKMIIEKL